MDAEPGNSQYAKIIGQAIEMGRLLPKKGTASFLIWDDRTHFDRWMSLAQDRLNDVRIISVPNNFVVKPGLLTLPPEIVIGEVTILGVGFGKATDYSDTQLMYFQVNKLGR